MRIAICLSGQPRTWRHTLPSLRRFFEAHEIDVFLHTWNEGDPAELAAMREAYDPRAEVVEDRPLFVAEKRRLAERFPTRPPLAVFDMFHSVAASLDLALRDPGGGYDLVCRARFDALFDGAWSGEGCAPGVVITPEGYPDPRGCNDQFALGDPQAMRAYAGMARWLPAGLEALQEDWFRPELALGAYLQDECGLTIAQRPLAMRLLREEQVGQPYAAVFDDPLFHAEKHEAWEAFAETHFSAQLTGRLDFAHAGRTALQLDRALAAWLDARQPKDRFALLKAPWPRRVQAVDAFISAETGGLKTLSEESYQGVRMICAMLLQRMGRREPMTLESFLVHALSANIKDMERAAMWAEADVGRLERLPRVLKGLGPLAAALDYAPPFAQTGQGLWRAG